MCMSRQVLFRNANDYSHFLNQLAGALGKTKKGYCAAYQQYIEQYLLSVDNEFKAELTVSRHAVGNGYFLFSRSDPNGTNLR